AVAIVHVDVGHVFDVGIRMSATPGGDAAGLEAQNVIDNGQVVRRQVPDHVDVALKEAQVDANAIDVIEIAQLAVVDKLLDAADSVVKQVSVIDHEDALVPLGQGDELLGFLDVSGQRFFDEHV